MIKLSYAIVAAIILILAVISNFTDSERSMKTAKLLLIPLTILLILLWLGV